MSNVSDSEYRRRPRHATPEGAAHDAEPSSFVTGMSSELRWFLGISVLASLLLGVGIRWLHSQPPGPSASRVSNATIEVELLRPAHIPKEERQSTTPALKSQDADLQPSRSAEEPRPVRDDPSPVEQMQSASPHTEPAEENVDTKPNPSEIASRTPSGGVASQYQRTLLSHIQRYRRYPNEARLGRLQGVTQIVFVLRRDGKVLETWLDTSSGHPILDHAALETIRRAEPLPTIPPELPGQLNVLIPIEFSLPR